MTFRRVFRIFAILAAMLLIFGSSCNRTDYSNGNSMQEKTKYKITFNLNGGAFTDDNFPKYFEEGESVQLPIPVKQNQIFCGWYDNSDFMGESYTVLDGKYVHTDKVFWAKWSSNQALPHNSDTYRIILILNGGKIKEGENIESYKAGEKLKLPEPYKYGYIFDGWYEDIEFSNSRVTEITEDCTGDKIFYAKWVVLPEEIEKFNIYYELNGGEFTGFYPTEYYKGIVTLLPLPVRERYLFGGWFDNANFIGKAFSEISQNSEGDLKFYAKWNPPEDMNKFSVLNYGGYEEGAFAEFKKSDNFSLSDYFVEYCEVNGVSAWRKIDSNLIRNYGSYIRADIVGLAPGNYNLKIGAPGFSELISGIKVQGYDRSGYAHFNSNSSIGAYNYDGTLKQNAKVLYLSEQNKNNIKMEIGGIVYTGINTILSQAGKLDGVPLTVRIIGKVNLEDIKISAASNVTIEGIGVDAGLIGGRFEFSECSSIEIRNLIFSDMGNACKFKGNLYRERYTSERIWVHNNEFINGDEAVVFEDVSYVTLSYNRYINVSSGELIKISRLEKGFYTFHHNLYNGCQSLKCAENANIHLYNNLYLLINSGPVISLDSGAFVFMENCYFDNCASELIITKNSAAKIWNTKYENCRNFAGEGIFKAESREQRFEFSAFDTGFDSDSKVFYFDDRTKTTAVEFLYEPDQVKNLLNSLVGVHKAVTE